MGKEFFSVDRASGLELVPSNGRIHVIGVCGVAMAQLAIELTERGYSVSGSDVEFYEPMGGLLRRSSVSLKEGYRAENIPTDVSLVVIGNSISYGNPEVAIVEQRGLPYTLFPKLLFELVISGKHSIVISGTHGKSTTSGLCASVLYSARRDPGYFIGGVVEGLPKSLHVGTGTVSVVEGDEYDSAFFAKVPKFSFYRPDTLVVTAIEYDHADIYPDLQSIEREFNTIVSKVPASGQVICCVDDENIRRLISAWRANSKARIISYGLHDSSDFRIISRTSLPNGQSLSLRSKAGESLRLTIPLMGAHNARNSVSVFLACRAAGILDQEILDGLSKFQGVKRRQEIRAENGGILLIEDFAHHPTAVHETLSAVRERYTDRRIWAVFEPRSNTSRRKIFQDAYIEAFKNADEVILASVSARKSDEGQELLNVSELAEKIFAAGTPARVIDTPDNIAQYLKGEMRPGDLILVMSNGSFGGLIDTLEHHIGSI